ncbi:MAG: hypothetical protein GY804_04545 [Alphaproteobacteria bacterium]|nr:hypothetical protein [Alphaproteobacteria bacterium]
MQTDVSQTHTTVIYNFILKKHNLPQITQKSFNENGIPCIDGVTGIERDVLENKIDARDYAIKELDWIRVAVKGYKLIQLKNLTPSVKERLSLNVPKGIYDIESINKFYPQTRVEQIIN